MPHVHQVHQVPRVSGAQWQQQQLQRQHLQLQQLQQLQQQQLLQAQQVQLQKQQQVQREQLAEKQSFARASLPTPSNPFQHITAYMQLWDKQPLSVVAIVTPAVQFELCKEPTGNLSATFLSISSRNESGVEDLKVHNDRRNMVIAHLTLEAYLRLPGKRVAISFANRERKQQVSLAELQKLVERESPGIVISCSPTNASLIVQLPQLQHKFI